MATTLTLSATDSLSQQNVNDKWKQKLEKVKEADGAGYLSSPEQSPIREKLALPASPQLEPSATVTSFPSSSSNVSSFPSTSASYPSSSSAYASASTAITKALSNPLREQTVISSDPLEFLNEYIASVGVRPDFVPESPIEKQILQAQSRKTEEILAKRKRDRELALALEARIMEKESLLVQLQADMRRKVKHIENKKEDLEQFRLDFAEQVKQSVPSSSTVQKSSRNRMEEEREKKKLLAQWRSNNSEDTLAALRKSILSAQDEVTDLNLRIIAIKKDLDLLQRMAINSVSSTFIMADMREHRAQNAMMGIARPSAEPKPKGPPPAPVQRAHVLRMQEEKERKALARAARLNASSSNYASSSSPSNFASSSKTIQAN